MCCRRRAGTGCRPECVIRPALRSTVVWCAAVAGETPRAALPWSPAVCALRRPPGRAGCRAPRRVPRPVPRRPRTGSGSRESRRPGARRGRAVGVGPATLRGLEPVQAEDGLPERIGTCRRPDTCEVRGREVDAQHENRPPLMVVLLTASVGVVCTKGKAERTPPPCPHPADTTLTPATPHQPRRNFPGQRSWPGRTTAIGGNRGDRRNPYPLGCQRSVGLQSTCPGKRPSGPLPSTVPETPDQGVCLTSPGIPHWGFRQGFRQAPPSWDLSKTPKAQVTGTGFEAPKRLLLISKRPRAAFTVQAPRV